MVLATMPAASLGAPASRDVSTLDDVDVRGKRVLRSRRSQRPDDATARSPTTRASTRRSPTLRWLHEHGARTIVLSHLGRPDGKPDPTLLAAPGRAGALRAARHRRSRSPTTASARRRARASRALHDGDVAAARERALSPRGRSATIRRSRDGSPTLGDLYVNDAFGTAHRAHASTEGVAHLLAQRRRAC